MADPDVTDPLVSPLAPSSFDPLPATLPALPAMTIHRSLADALRAIPAGKRGALLIDARFGGHASAQLAAKIGDDWTVALGGAWDGHRIVGGVILMGAW